MSSTLHQQYYVICISYLADRNKRPEIPVPLSLDTDQYKHNICTVENHMLKPQCSTGEDGIYKRVLSGTPKHQHKTSENHLNLTSGFDWRSTESLTYLG